jgi:polyhydroxyalkanoate synthase
MTKQPKELPPFFFPGNGEGSSYATSGKWNGTWHKIAAENLESMAQHMKASLTAPVPWIDKPLFNPEEVKNVFTQTMENLSEMAKSKQELPARDLVDVPAYLNSTLKQFKNQGSSSRSRSVTPQHSPQEQDENPFFYLLHQSYLLNLQFLKDVGNRIDPLLSRKLTFYTHHLVDALSVTPHPFSNTASLQGALKSSSLPITSPSPKKTPVALSSQGPHAGFKLGKNLALTPGKVVFQNELFQLIQYKPLTPKVAKRPLLIIPSWANKYYIFDLNTENSFVRWAVESGLTVFIISWVNPPQKSMNKTFTDYVLKGARTALDQVCQITGVNRVNAVGYCAGGTLLSCLLGYMTEKKDHRISSATFLATPFDASKMDELGIYRSECPQPKPKVNKGKEVLFDGQYVMQALNLLKANDLIWSTDVNHYLLGQEPFPFAMLYWTCDALRLPTKMHNTYLRDVLIENKLMTGGELTIDEIPVHLKKIKTPLFVMAAQEDHVAPWRSVYALTQMAKDAPQKFILSGAGHVKGVFNPPKAQTYHFWKSTSLPRQADEWLKKAKKQTGSWWDEWRQWLVLHEGGQIKARIISKEMTLEDAPGAYAKVTRES